MEKQGTVLSLTVTKQCTKNNKMKENKTQFERTTKEGNRGSTHALRGSSDFYMNCLSPSPVHSLNGITKEAKLVIK